MWFRKEKSVDPCPYPGVAVALDGQAAIMAVESLGTEAVLVQADAGLDELTGPLARLVPGEPVPTRAVDELAQLPATMAGMAATGMRCSAVVDEIAPVADQLAGMAGKRLSTVIHLVTRCRQRQATAVHGSHDDYLSVSHTGAVQLFARNVQEAADLALIGRRIAEQSLTPVVCGQEFHSTSQSLQSLRLPEPALVQEYLGLPGDRILAPNRAQEVLFGASRRRIPRLVDMDRPVGTGGVQGQEGYFRAVAAQRPFFADALPSMVEQAMQDFTNLTHRGYSPVSAYRTQDADYVIVAMGSVVDALCAAVDQLRASEGVRVGVLNLTLWRPFPGRAVAEMLRGKRGVTVMESTDMPLAEDLPMLSELRCALGKAMENGKNAAGAPAHPGYPVYHGLDEMPSLYSAIYGVGSSLPGLGELAAVIKNMLPGAPMRRRCYVGVDFTRVSRKYPQLQVLQQSLAAAYPDLASISLPPVPVKSPAPNCSLVRVHALSGEGAIAAGTLFARAMAQSMGLQVRTRAVGGAQSGLQKTCLDIFLGAEPIRDEHREADVMLVAGTSLLRGIPREAMRSGGTLIVSACEQPASLWKNLPRDVRDWISGHALEVYVVDAQEVARVSAESQGHLDQLAIWALLGSALAFTHPGEAANGEFREALGGLLDRLFADSPGTCAEVLTAMDQGSRKAQILEWARWKDEPPAPQFERAAPWSAAAENAGQAGLFDPARFWHSVGFLYDEGDQQETLADPLLATGTMPGRSSAHRDMSSFRLRLPRWMAENCTGCGQCWAQCPDSALPPTIQSVDGLLEAGITRCKEAGQAMTQMARIAGHLAAQAYRIVARDDLKQYRTAGPLLTEAFQQLSAKMGLEGEARDKIAEDLDALVGVVGAWRFARTQRYFDGAAKGEGKLLSIALNTDSCKACGLCMAVCPDEAMGWEPQTAERLEKESTNWALQMAMPPVSPGTIQALIRPEEPESELARLLNTESYLSLVGGDSALPAHPGKTAVHLVSAAVTSVMQARYQAHVDRLIALQQGLEARIQDEFCGAVRISDFEAFSRRLATLATDSAAGNDLAGIIGKENLEHSLNPDKIARLNGLLEALKNLIKSYQGPRARMVLALQRGDVTTWSGSYPDNPHAAPWLSHDRGMAPALAQGMFQGMCHALAAELAVCRQAERAIADGAVNPGAPTLPVFDELTPEEQALVPPVVMVAEAEAVHWDDLARVFDAGFPVTLVLLDRNGIDLDAGPGASAGARHALNAISANAGYVLQGTTADPAHLLRGVAESLGTPGAALMRIYTPDPMANAQSGAEVSRDAALALNSRAVPAFVFRPGVDQARGQLDLAGNPAVEVDWPGRTLAVQPPGGSREQIDTVLTLADWAVTQPRLRRHFTLMSKGRLSDDMRPLDRYLAMDRAERIGLTPYIRLADGSGKWVIASLSGAMAEACERGLHQWRQLQRLAGSAVQAPAPAEQARPVDAAPASQAPIGRAPDQDVVVARLLALCGYDSDPDFFNQSLREFLASEDARERPQ